VELYHHSSPLHYTSTSYLNKHRDNFTCLNLLASFELVSVAVTVETCTLEVLGLNLGPGTGSSALGFS
jgi:hypothetical protein